MNNIKTFAAIEMINVSKWYDKFEVLKNINLQVAQQEKLVICGPSGSGKSTLLRCINRLESYQEGEIYVQGVELNDNEKNIEQIRREVGMCFQQFNLFPHLSALENCTLALIWVRKMSKSAAIEVARKYLDRVKILDQADKYPAQLSGGQQQRVAIARSLCMNPQIMLFDEPTSALDPEMIKEVLDVIVDLANDGMTLVCVTHEMNFARTIADRIILLDAGAIIEQNTPERFFTEPETERARVFLNQISYKPLS